MSPLAVEASLLQPIEEAVERSLSHLAVQASGLQRIEQPVELSLSHLAAEASGLQRIELPVELSLTSSTAPAGTTGASGNPSPPPPVQLSKLSFCPVLTGRFAQPPRTPALGVGGFGAGAGGAGDGCSGLDGPGGASEGTTSCAA